MRGLHARSDGGWAGGEIIGKAKRKRRTKGKHEIEEETKAWVKGETVE